MRSETLRPKLGEIYKGLWNGDKTCDRCSGLSLIKQAYNLYSWLRNPVQTLKKYLHYLMFSAPDTHKQTDGGIGAR